MNKILIIVASLNRINLTHMRVGATLDPFLQNIHLYEKYLLDEKISLSLHNELR